jgi:DNA-binding transcriptional LysR family regulator
MEMHQVRYFLAVSRTLNFTRAAEECHVAQPSLTRAIKLLEAELGADLFRRERTLTHLTEFGQRMLPILRQCHESALAAKKLASAIRSGAAGTISLGLSHTIPMTLLVPALSEVLRAFPGLELAFLRGTAAEVMEHLKKGDTALAVAGPLGEAWERLDAWPLFNEPFRVLVGATHRLGGRDRLTLEEIRAERVLARPYCELAAAIEAFARDRSILQTGGHCVASEQDVAALVAAGVGVSIVPRSIPCPAELRTLEADGMELERTVSLYAVAGRERAPAATALMKLLRACDWSTVIS